MTKAMELACKEYVGVLADAVPGLSGGGGAASFVGAIGMALGQMVGTLTANSKKYADRREQVEALNAKAKALEEELLALVAKDAEAFLPLQAAYALPHGTEEEKAHKKAVKEQALQGATEVPLSIMESCCKAIALHGEFVSCGTPLAISDVGCGVAFCAAALRAASLNVFINTNLMQDKERAKALTQQAQTMLKEYLPLAEEIYQRAEAYFLKEE